MGEKQLHYPRPNYISCYKHFSASNHITLPFLKKKIIIKLKRNICMKIFLVTYYLLCRLRNLQVAKFEFQENTLLNIYQLPFLDASKLSQRFIFWVSQVRVVLGNKVLFLLIVFTANLNASSSAPIGPRFHIQKYHLAKKGKITQFLQDRENLGRYLYFYVCYLGT